LFLFTYKYTYNKIAPKGWFTAISAVWGVCGLLNKPR